MSRSLSLPATITCAAAALVGFAGNSLLARAALGEATIDAATFTFARLATGALVLALIAGLSRPRQRGRTSAGWLSPAALFAYAAAFSFAYLQLGAGIGALILFAAVQVTMIGWGLANGERPGAQTWAGLLLALGGLVGLTLPGTHAPDWRSTVRMTFAGVAWGVYSLRGRGTENPLAATTTNFAWAVPLALGLSLANRGAFHTTGRGLALAAASGALASGVGYSLWYAALPSMTATQAAISQLVVPVLAAAAAAALLNEVVTTRLLLAGSAILAGVLLALTAPQQRTTP